MLGSIINEREIKLSANLKSKITIEIVIYRINEK